MDTKASFDHDGGQVVSVFTFNYDNPISNLGEVFSFSTLRHSSVANLINILRS